MIRIEADETSAGARIDVFLAGKLEGQTRSSVQKLLAQGMVTKDGKACAKNLKVSSGDVFSVVLPEPEPDTAIAQDIPLDIIYEDDDLIVVNKPRGLVVHPAAGHRDGTLVNALLHHCGDSLSGIGGVMRPGIVHRIDRDTSGLLVAAKNDETHRGLSAQLSDHSMYRIYCAVVIGTPSPEEGTVDACIARDPKNRQRMAVVPGGKNAVTHYKVLERFPGYSLVRCRLETGRTHQIRVHMASIGHPVAGDPVYGPKRDALSLGGQCLHAQTLSFVHPRTLERMEFSCALPDYFEAVLEKLRKKG